MRLARGSRRTRVLAGLVVACAALGCSELTAAADGPEVHPALPAHGDIGPDLLAQFAAEALDAWDGFATNDRNSTIDDFVVLRDLVAAEAALRLEIDPVRMQAAWAVPDRQHQLAVLAAFTQLGVPYRSLARRAGVGFDCSGITSWAWEQAGRPIPRASRYQISHLPSVAPEFAKAGDLVSYPGHVMLYLGVDTAILHSPNTGSTVHLSKIWSRKLNRLKWADPLG